MNDAPDRYPAGVPCWVEALSADVEAASSFYAGLFSWQFEEIATDDPGVHLLARLDGVEVAGIASSDEQRPNATWTTYVRSDDVDALVERAEQAGASALRPPAMLGASARSAVLHDPAGATFGVWQAGTLSGALAMNVPGSWNFSELNTPDVEAAQSFYGSLFGWRASLLDFGGESGPSYLWRLPGYGDHLERLDPGIRRRHVEAGTPEGFTDAVAWLLPSEQDPRWNVTFAVADCDATAARAEQLGGTLMSPTVVGPTRIAIIADPGGAAFTVSHYAP